jgi:hypothetical protein
VQAQPKLRADTAIVMTSDEGDGYYDSGYVQALDYFGDGTRIPAMVVSNYSTGGHISHSYTDHVSILKFIEANWTLPTVTGRSRDNLPNAKTAKSNPYVPVNSLAIGDMMDLFDFNWPIKRTQERRLGSKGGALSCRLRRSRLRRAAHGSRNRQILLRATPDHCARRRPGQAAAWSFPGRRPKTGC